MKKNILISTLLLPIFACSNDGGDSSPPTNSTKTGVFLDSPVINIGYRTETISDGVTNSLGEFKYLQGEKITFFIGDLTLPPTQAAEVVTPLDLANAQDTSNSTVVNIIRLLQTLDKNGNPNDGITITNSAISIATPVDFNLDIASFESSSAVANLIPNITDLDSSVLRLISTEDAISNFEQSLDDAFSVDMT